jgi:hypothetical protein
VIPEFLVLQVCLEFEESMDYLVGPDSQDQRESLELLEALDCQECPE